MCQQGEIIVIETAGAAVGVQVGVFERGDIAIQVKSLTTIEGKGEEEDHTHLHGRQRLNATVMVIHDIGPEVEAVKVGGHDPKKGMDITLDKSLETFTSHLNQPISLLLCLHQRL
jgi:hypothetical protein